MIIIGDRWNRLPFVQIAYLKQHRSKKSDTELPADRTLFVANCSLGEEGIKGIFQKFGAIEKVKLGEFASKRIGYSERDTLSGLMHGPVGAKHAHIVFERPSAVRAALSCSEILECEDCISEPTDLLSMVISAHRSRNISADDLQASVDSHLAAFDERSEAEKRLRREGLIDDDGFQLVTYKRKNRHVDPLTVEAPVAKKKELADFYRFQIREKKRWVARVPTHRTRAGPHPPPARRSPATPARAAQAVAFPEPPPPPARAARGLAQGGGGDAARQVRGGQEAHRGHARPAQVPPLLTAPSPAARSAAAMGRDSRAAGPAEGG